MEQSAQRMIMEAKKIIGLSNSQILRLVLPPTVSIIPSWFIHCTLLSLALILFNLSVHARLSFEWPQCPRNKTCCSATTLRPNDVDEEPD
jgi:hypothetical protein